MSMQIENHDTRELAHQIDRIGWALLFILTGGLLLVPDVPDGAWLIGISVILLGEQVVRFFNQIPVVTFGLVLGAGALLLGLADLAGLVTWLHLVSVVLILIGLSIALPSRLGGEHAHQPVAS